MKTQRKILVVDDDPVVGKSFEKVLTSKGYAVINCHSGAEALEKLGKEEYDAVFTDLKMPEMDGMEVATRVKASQPWMPIVIVTGYGSKESRIQAETLGITDFMQKPLTPEMIEESADRAMLEKQSIVDVVEEVAAPVAEEQQSKALAIALFFAAPFIGLLYAMFMPIVGLGMLAYVAYKAFAKTKVFTHVKNVGLLISAPFIGLAYAVSMPFVGIGMLLYVGGKAAFK
jgi:CheY-like chemotaxis protein